MLFNCKHCGESFVNLLLSIDCQPKYLPPERITPVNNGFTWTKEQWFREHTVETVWECPACNVIHKFTSDLDYGEFIKIFRKIVNTDKMLIKNSVVKIDMEDWKRKVKEQWDEEDRKLNREIDNYKFPEEKQEINTHKKRKKSKKNKKKEEKKRKKI